MNSDMGHGDKGSDKTCNDHENERKENLHREKTDNVT